MSSPQTVQVHARRGGTDHGHDSKIGARSCTAIHQAVKDASSGRLADRSRDSGHRDVGMNIHILMINEAMKPQQSTYCRIWTHLFLPIVCKALGFPWLIYDENAQVGPSDPNEQREPAGS